MAERKKMLSFIDNIKKDKLSGWQDKEYAIVYDWKLGFRLDHQGLNNDPSTKPHRIYIQPVKGGKSDASKGSSKRVLASIHCDDPEDDQKIRDGLIDSYVNKKDDVVV